MKSKNVYSCQQCGTIHRKWLGRCEDCGTWNSIIEETQLISTATMSSFGGRGKAASLGLTDLAMISSELYENGQFEDDPRYDIGIEELNRVLGGGIVQNSTILIAGEPGIGKSTLLLQMCDMAAKQGFSCLYASGEESAAQIRMRARRLHLDNAGVKLISTNNIGNIMDIARKMGKDKFREDKITANHNEQGESVDTIDLNQSPIYKKILLVIDSIQTIYSEIIQSTPGTVTQVKACAFELIRLAKEELIIVVIVGHVTKDGQIAGPKLLEHMVDTVLSFEGENTRQYRILRTTKNRYGSTNEIGVFEMSNGGLMEVANPSSVFLSEHTERASGTCIFAGIEGSRSILLEIQSLVVDSFLATPRRATIGWDNNRLAMLIAILHSRFGLSLFNKEVYLNIAGGLKINETAVDLAVIVALVSSALNITVPRNFVFFGEVGLSGEIRSVPQSELRIQEATKLGFSTIVCPYDAQVSSGKAVELLAIKHINNLTSILGIPNS